MIHCPHCGGALDAPGIALAIRKPRPKDQKLLGLLMEARPKAIELRQLIEGLYGSHPSATPTDEKSAVRARISRLRHRLAASGWTVENEPGVGYRLERIEGGKHD